MSEHQFADLWEQIADAFPDAQAQVHGDRRQTWAELDRRADGVAKALLDLGVERQDKVAQYLYNCPEYLESRYGTVKASLVPVNTNYRYGQDELLYLWDNADAAAVVFHGSFTERIEEIRDRLPKVRLWLWVDDGHGSCPDWAAPYEEAATAATERVRPSWGRSGEDIYMLYTGGTTGMPKGVMWQMGDLIDAFAQNTGGPGATWQMPAAPGPVAMPACPLMHGTGAFVSFIGLNLGGSVVTLTGRSFSAEEMLDTIQREKVNMIAIVGDAFGKPMLAALEDNPGRWDISSLLAMISSGVMWSEETKQGLLKHHPGMILQDAFSSSEALGMGQSVSTAGSVSTTAKFQLGENARVITEDGREIEAVHIVYGERITFCLSSQVGCALKCGFCLTATMGLLRDLTPGEILGQVSALARAGSVDLKTLRIVFMGMGEPLHNYDAVLEAFRILVDPLGFGLQPRRVTLSTVGLVPGIERLARENPRPRLAVSLSASTDALRDRLVPVNRKHDLASVVKACRAFPLGARERITFEYILLHGINDGRRDADGVARLLHGVRAKVNVILYNDTGLEGFRTPPAAVAARFRDALLARGIPASIRWSKGRDIGAACGQLARGSKPPGPAP